MRSRDATRGGRAALAAMHMNLCPNFGHELVHQCKTVAFVTCRWLLPRAVVDDLHGELAGLVLAS